MQLGKHALFFQFLKSIYLQGVSFDRRVFEQLFGGIVKFLLFP